MTPNKLTKAEAKKRKNNLIKRVGELYKAKTITAIEKDILIDYLNTLP